MHLRVLVFALFWPLLCHAQEKDFSTSVDPWRKSCDETVCTFTLLNDLQGAKTESDYFALGFAVNAKSKTPDYFVFSYPPTAVRSQVVLTLVILETLPTGRAAKVVGSASFGTDPCEAKKDCKRRFNQGIIPELKAGGFKEMDVWRALKTHLLLDVMQTFEIDGVRHLRSALIALPAFQDATREFPIE